MKEFIDKLISRFEEYPTYSFGVSLLNTEEYIKVSDVKKIVNQLAEEYKVSEMPTGWIPCSERLPEKKTLVLVTYTNVNDDVRIEVTLYEPKKKSFWISPNVIAWMPLPAPYAEGE